MRTSFLGLVSLILLIASGAATAAGSCTGCRVKSLGTGPYYDYLCTSGACVFIAMEGSVSGRPGCSTNPYWHFVLNLNSPSGKATFAQLLASKASGQLLNIMGTNNCGLSAAAASEDFSYAMETP
jgi:hypothetical protein